MPNFDGTGPMGMGPMGKGMGPCGRYPQGRGRGFGRGFFGLSRRTPEQSAETMRQRKNRLESELRAVNTQLEELQKENGEPQD
ncbi:MAG: DUF5320 family protein [Anaerolineaceae bacterium]|jgi:hypothetical protein